MYNIYTISNLPLISDKLVARSEVTIAENTSKDGLFVTHATVNDNEYSEVMLAVIEEIEREVKGGMDLVRLVRLQEQGDEAENEWHVDIYASSGIFWSTGFDSKEEMYAEFNAKDFSLPSNIIDEMQSFVDSRL